MKDALRAEVQTDKKTSPKDSMHWTMRRREPERDEDG